MTQEQIVEIDRRLSPWRQGDVVTGAAVPFIHVADLAAPTTPEAEQLAKQIGGSGIDLVSVETTGFVVVSQTCDLLRSCQDRPYVEICPLVSLQNDQMDLVRRGRIPRFAALPALDNEKLVADLDRVMTVEKGLLASMSEQRKSGVLSELQAQILTEALGRKRTRAAFPEEFTRAVGSMRDRILDKHKRKSPEGDFVRSVKEIRVRSIPDWSALDIEVEFLFVFDRGANIPTDADKWITQLLNLVIIGGQIGAVDGRAVGLDQLSAASYVESHRLDLDHLSHSFS